MRTSGQGRRTAARETAFARFVAALLSHERSRLRRYAVGAAAAGIALLLTAALGDVLATSKYVLLIGAVLVSVGYGGIGAGLVTVALGWTGAAALVGDWPGEELPRWSLTLALALALVGFSSAMWWSRARTERAAEEAVASRDLMARLHDLSSSLSAAVTPSDIARELVRHTPPALGAVGGAFGLVDGDDVVIVDPDGAPAQTLAPGLRLPLRTKAPITTAARENRPVWVTTRERFEQEFPDGAALAPSASGATAVPITVDGRVVGAMGFPFQGSPELPEAAVPIAGLAAALGGQALERAGLYEHERGLRESLERILRVAPRFRSDDPDRVVTAICREARASFGVDVVQLWTAVGADAFQVRWREPEIPEIAPGEVIPMSDFPGLREAMEALEVMFVPDTQQVVHGIALEHARAAGVHSSLRVPIVIGGHAARVLALQWRRVVDEPDPSFVALARRFADQAALALERAERRRAQEAATRNAEETQRLLDITASLAGAATPQEVATALLTEGRRHLGALAGGVAVCGDELLEVVATTGYPAETTERWRTVDREASLPLAEAVRRNRIVTVESASELERRYPLAAARPAELTGGSWMASPLTVGAGVVGGIVLSFAAGRRFDDADQEFVSALARQGGQALDRARLYQAEREARARAERMASGLAQMHALATSLARATSATDVAQAVGAQIASLLGASLVGLWAVDEHDGCLQLLDATGGPGAGALLDRYATIPADAAVPVAVAVSESTPVWVQSESEWAAVPERSHWQEAGMATLGAVPLLLDEAAIGTLVVGFQAGAEVDPDARRFVETVARQAAPPLDRVRALERERAARLDLEKAIERTHRLQAVTQGLAATLTSVDVGDVIVDEGVRALGADAAVLYVLETDGALQLVAHTGYAEEDLAGWERLPADRPAPVPDVLRGGESVLVLDAPETITASYPGLERTLERTDDRAWMVVRLAVGERALGAFLLAYRSPRRFDDADRALALTVGRQSAQALDRARLFELEHATALRIRQLQDVTSALSQAVTVHEVGSTCLEQGAAAVGATLGAIVVDDPADGEPAVVAHLGFEDGELDAWLAEALAPDGIATEARRGSEPVWRAAVADGARSWVGLPLAGAASGRGALVLGFPDRRELPREDREWLAALAAQCAQALERSRLYDEERLSRRRSDVLQDLTAALSGSLTPDEVARVFLTRGRDAANADSGAIAVVDAGGALRTVAWEGPAERPAWTPSDSSIGAHVPAAAALRRGHPILYADARRLAADYPALADALEAEGAESFLFAPLVSAGRALGVVSLAWRSSAAFDRLDPAFLEALASQAAQALDRASRYETERTIAETLQRSVMPERLPDVDGTRLAARYLPGTEAMDVGGDWYDVISLREDLIGLVVGDVVGKGVHAAATMAQLRNALRAFALDTVEPAAAVSQLNRLVEGLVDAPFATLGYVVLDPVRRTARITSAGHPPPLLVLADGGTSYLEGGRGLPLGVGVELPYDQDTVELPPGALLVLYTDGLVERRDRPLQTGLELLAEAAARGPVEPEAVLARVLEALLGDADRGDDVAVLAVQLEPAPGVLDLLLPAEQSSLVRVREELATWLASFEVGPAVVHDVVLAAWEACANAVEHAQRPTGLTFSLHAEVARDTIRIVVRDSGRWRPPRKRADRGLGLQLMRGLMTSVEVSPGASGTAVVLTRALSGRAEAPLAGSRGAPQAP